MDAAPRPPPGWACLLCGNTNFAMYALCLRCHTPNPHPAAPGGAPPAHAMASARAPAALPPAPDVVMGDAAPLLSLIHI